VVDRRFWIADGRRADFEVVFGTAGIWRELLSRGDGYLATEIECESVSERRYRVRDFWVRHLGFELFRERFAAEYERFERLILSDGLVERLELVGAYYEDKPGGGDELVPG
jgi:hypothetical protein